MHDLSKGKLRRFLLGNRLRSLILLASVLILLVSSFFVGNTVTHAASYCQVTYSLTNQWPGGFGGSITVQNTSSTAWTSWNLGFTFPASGQTVTQGWSGVFTQSGQKVTVVNETWNGSIAVNGSVNPGFNGSWTTSNPVPTTFTVNGNTCNGSGGATPTPTTGVTPTATTGVTPTPTKGVTPTPTTGVTPTPTTGVTPTPTTGVTPTPTGTPVTGPHLPNPYAGAQGYVNPDWAAEVKAGAASVGGTLGTQEAKVAQYSTAVWLDSMAAISGTGGYARSLAGHLDQAELQAASSSQPIVITLVIYDLPGRDCAALASNGEIPATGLSTYETQYIDPIAATLSQAKYSNLRIVAIIEPDSLPNLVTNLSLANCAAVNSNGAYVKGVQYALSKLHAISNVYNYVDIGHYGWLGWTSNFGPAVTLISNTIKGAVGGVNSVDGFISDTANYVATVEPYMTANETISGNPVRSATFFQWNTYIDQASFDADWKTALIAQGFPSTIGMLTDTSRNGWGGTGRPTGASTSTDLNTFANATRLDRRIGVGNWCNQPGGIGARPQANPGNGYEAYVWIKPPGESDGSSSLIPTGPANPGGKGFDRMCDPTFGGDPLNNNLPTGAMPNSPVSGAWFQAGFNVLVQNAYPAL
jgi:cellulose 1,4-beta-cellobiosidase